MQVRLNARQHTVSKCSIRLSAYAGPRVPWRAGRPDTRRASSWAGTACRVVVKRPEELGDNLPPAQRELLVMLVSRRTTRPNGTPLATSTVRSAGWHSGAML